MPHSSGGGSHGGGSHGGSSFSSGSSSSGGSGGVRTSRNYYPGCRTYVYYRNRRPYYIYANGDIAQTRAGNILGIIIIAIFMAVVGFAILGMNGKTPTKIHNNQNYEIVVEDNANVIDEADADLNKALNEFKETTGITPAIMTVNNEDWNNFYTDLYVYAYDLYVNNFEDEAHFLIVYSVPSGENKKDWFWEGIQGYDCDDILTESKCDEYLEKFHGYLLADTRYTDTQAFTKLFNDMNESIMDKPAFNNECIPLIGVEVFLLILLICIFISIKNKGYKISELKEVKNSKEKQTERNCDYCGGLYVVGVHDSCPHCGARILAEDYQPENNQ